eukprot:259104_1
MKLLTAFLLLSPAQGFVLPSIQPGSSVEKLVDILPPIGENDPLDLATRTALVPFILYSPFAIHQQEEKSTKTQTTLPFSTEGEIDYDAPIERQLEVGHIVRRQPYTIGLGDVGTIMPPSFLQEAFNLYKPEHEFELPVEGMDEHYYTLVHDECYLGKDLTSHDCVDFDPLHKGKSHSH